MYRSASRKKQSTKRYARLFPCGGLCRELQLWKRGVQYVAGVDEAGRGPLAGPVVAAAVIFEPGTYIPGVDDSKKLTPSMREKLFSEIKKRAVSVGIGIVQHDTIDEMNIRNASLFAMKKAVSKLKVVPEYLLVDGNDFDGSIPFETIVHGDSRSFSIAAASIVAKVTRDRLMRAYHNLFPQYGFDRHKGYATKQHIRAIKKYGICEIHRRSFHVKELGE